MSENLISLHPYQNEVACAIYDSYDNEKGLTLSVEIARQGGKNELSAQIEVVLLNLARNSTRNLVKCSPTFRPQSIVSMMRLIDRLNDEETEWVAEKGYIIRVDDARAIFLSAEEHASVVGHTAHILLEIDESQDVAKDKYNKDFKPMGATTNVTTVHYGTTWDNSTLLEEVKQTNLELERKDGIKRHFRYDWQEVAKYNPDYRAYVEAERERLGANHPLFLTQYCLIPIGSAGRLFTPQHRAQLQGQHSRRHQPEPGKLYVAGIDLAGEAEDSEGNILKAIPPRQDSTVVTIGELFPVSTILKQMGVKIIEHYRWTGTKHAELYQTLVDLLNNVWSCKRVVVDATGIGEPVASFLRQAIGSKVLPFKFTQQSKSELGFELLAAINSGRLKMYRGDGSAEAQELWFEVEHARSQYRPSQTMNFYVDLSEGHDDFLMSLALLVEAANQYEPRAARGSGA